MNIGVGVTVNSAGGSTGYYVEHSFDPIFDATYGSSLRPILSSNATWYQNGGITNGTSSGPATVNHDGNYSFPVTAIRLNVLTQSVSSGTVTLSLLQAGV